MTRSSWVVLLLLGLSLLCPLVAADDGPLALRVEVPVKNQEIYAADTLVAGTAWDERVRVTFTNTGTVPLTNVTVRVDVPLGMPVSVPPQPLPGVAAEGGGVAVTVGELAPGEAQNMTFGVRPPASVEHRIAAPFLVNATYRVNGESRTATLTHEASIIPPLSWITYGTIGVSLLFLLVALVFFRRSTVLQRFSTNDLVTIALIAALLGVVFRWFWQTFNDLLGPFGGLLYTIPTAVLLVLAVHLVRKPGTATLLFFVQEIVAMVIWGTNILLWLGWYLMEGVAVDLLCMVLGGDYADRRGTAVAIGIIRGFVSYGAFYLLFGPAVWHIAYAPWYSGLQIGLGVLGGIIGGWIGYSTAKKVRGSVL
ncbi:MAG TPA: ECF transporter S component [Methanoregulaceae archaeon]|nr:ECF transporter S component [Methanoregulaceae archaeon]HQJ88358.1 ECF transporter S component [Methanoregulaceae archaeon]